MLDCGNALWPYVSEFVDIYVHSNRKLLNKGCIYHMHLSSWSTPCDMYVIYIIRTFDLKHEIVAGFALTICMVRYL